MQTASLPAPKAAHGPPFENLGSDGVSLAGVEEEGLCPCLPVPENGISSLQLPQDPQRLDLHAEVPGLQDHRGPDPPRGPGFPSRQTLHCS